jgi:micrococcal nuclease
MVRTSGLSEAESRRQDDGMDRTKPRIMMLLIAFGATVSGSPASAETGQVLYVTDGDTFRLTSGERIRIANIDAPETHRGQAKCAQEIERSLAASARLRAMIDPRNVSFERTGRSYNRTVATVSVGGRDLGEMLIDSSAAMAAPPSQAGLVRLSAPRGDDSAARMVCAGTRRGPIGFATGE